MLKRLVSDKHSSLFVRNVGDEESKKIFNIGGRRKSEYRNKIDLNKFSDQSHSANWQRFVSDEFSRRMKDLLMGVRLESFDLMSPDRKARPTKCKCCQVSNVIKPLRPFQPV